jgi:hypothetical protein
VKKSASEKYVRDRARRLGYALTPTPDDPTKFHLIDLRSHPIECCGSLEKIMGTIDFWEGVGRKPDELIAGADALNVVKLYGCAK